MYHYGDPTLLENSVLIANNNLLEEDWYTDVKSVTANTAKAGGNAAAWLARKRHGNIPKYTDAIAKLTSSVFKKIEVIKPIADFLKLQNSGDLGKLNKMITGMDRKSTLSYVEILSAVFISALENPSDSSYTYVKKALSDIELNVDEDDEDDDGTTPSTPTPDPTPDPAAQPVDPDQGSAAPATPVINTNPRS